MAQPYIPPNTRFDVVKFEDLSIETTWTKLGEGSFGFVYRAQYLGLPVAIKEIIPRTDYDMEKYFARECRISREARHPNIVQYIGLCLAPPSIENNPNEYSETQREDEFLYGKKKPCRNVRKSRVLIISEYVPKGNLRNYLVSRSITTKAQPLTWRLRISFAIDIARAVAYLHERKCLHRDLKLDNCLLTENFRVKLCDFGLARFEAKTPEEVRQLSFCGTDGYMSPEVLRGAPFDLSTDVYSLGIIFCELISMKLAGASSSSSSICNESAFLQRAPPRYSIKSSDVTSLLETQEEGCPKTFIELSLRCTQVDRHLRPTLKEIFGLEDKDTNSMIDFGINSFFIDPRLLPLINMKKDMDATSDFFGSTLKMPGAVSVRKSFPSAFLNPPVEPMENLVAMQDILARSDAKKSAPSEFSLPEAAVASGVSGLNLSELGTIPTMTTNSIETSSTTDSFKLAMRELTQAYDNSTQASTSELDNAKVDLSGFVSLDSTPTNTHFLENGSTKGSTLTIVPDTFKFNQPSHSESQPQLQPESKGEGKPSNPLPHRFTIFKSHWLANLLNLNQKELSNQEAKTEKSCAACHKPIGSRKTFLRCDDCGENCHKKCSNSLELSHCKR
ncbi:hypothetical protein PtA15_16A308 [Puccinia triticina]|uniref:TKL/LISK/LISK-DD1 protein kinase n=1 Tax=Puccinia triticina TaxID=208348 RepID=A0ABY7D688_9BASI|nr:uncharacterized protein PtA15_16A308 [Puccinia triticina]WAQ92400.1 hypothetical protein PtA15_16A308 [Puccinia triticina]